MLKEGAQVIREEIRKQGRELREDMEEKNGKNEKIY